MRITVLCVACLLAVGCSRTSETHAADNTGRNARDRGGETLTPTDQSESASDRALTQVVRRALTDDESLSVNAKNIKVISQNGKVTLRGIVASQEEKEDVLAKVRAIPEVQDCDHQLDVKAN